MHADQESSKQKDGVSEIETSQVRKHRRLIRGASHAT